MLHIFCKILPVRIGEISSFNSDEFFELTLSDPSSIEIKPAHKIITKKPKMIGMPTFGSMYLFIVLIVALSLSFFYIYY